MHVTVGNGKTMAAWRFLVIVSPRHEWKTLKNNTDVVTYIPAPHISEHSYRKTVELTKSDISPSDCAERIEGGRILSGSNSDSHSSSALLQINIRKQVIPCTKEALAAMALDKRIRTDQCHWLPSCCRHQITA